MARYRKSSFFRDNIKGMLAGMAAALLVILVIRFGPVVKDHLTAPDSQPPTESVAPPAEEEAPPETSPTEEGGAESRNLGERLLTACKKFWPVLPVFIMVMEAVEYMGKFFKWIKNLF